MPDLSGVDRSHRPGLAIDVLFPGRVYCMVCGKLLTGPRVGCTRPGAAACTGPLGAWPCHLEPIDWEAS